MSKYFVKMENDRKFSIVDSEGKAVELGYGKKRIAYETSMERLQQALADIGYCVADNGRDIVANVGGNSQSNELRQAAIKALVDYNFDLDCYMETGRTGSLYRASRDRVQAQVAIRNRLRAVMRKELENLLVESQIERQNLENNHWFEHYGFRYLVLKPDDLKKRNVEKGVQEVEITAGYNFYTPLAHKLPRKRLYKEARKVGKFWVLGKFESRTLNELLANIRSSWNGSMELLCKKHDETGLPFHKLFLRFIPSHAAAAPFLEEYCKVLDNANTQDD